LQRVQREAEKVKLDTPKEQPDLPTPQKLPIEVPKPAAVTVPKPVRISAPVTALQTPPVMQTVIIKGRKYIAISATASDI